MAKYNIEFKTNTTNEFGSETKHVKTVRDNPSEVAAMVESAVAAGGGLEFLTVRLVPSVKSKVVTTTKSPVVK